MVHSLPSSNPPGGGPLGVVANEGPLGVVVNEGPLGVVENEGPLGVVENEAGCATAGAVAG